MRACLVHTHPGVFLVLRPAQGTGIQGRIEHVVRVYVCACIYVLILKSRALTTIPQRIERDVKKIRDYATVYSGTPGVKSNFRDYPGKSGRVGRSVHLRKQILLLASSTLGHTCTSFNCPLKPPCVGCPLHGVKF